MGEKVYGMIEFTMEAAGVPVGVRALFDSTKTYCQSYITWETGEFYVEITPEDLVWERQKAAKEDALEGLPVRNLTDAQLEVTALLRKITEELFLRNVLLFHGSVIAVDGEGYLFTAKSGTGKSTHTRLWRELLGSRGTMVNDDKPFLQVTQENVLVHGSAWMGKHGLGTRMAVPLKAICILERGAENRICQIPAKEAVYMLLQQSSRPQNGEKLPKYLELVDKIAASVSFYRMQCNMELEAAKVAYEAMSQQGKGAQV